MHMLSAQSRASETLQVVGGLSDARLGANTLAQMVFITFCVDVMERSRPGICGLRPHIIGPLEKHGKEMDNDREPCDGLWPLR